MPREDWRGGVDWDVFVRDHYTCRYCKLGVTEVGNRWDLFTADHLIPKEKGGPEKHPMNIVTACAGCNSSKGSTFDKSYKEGEWSVPKNFEEQERLVQLVNEQIKRRRNKWLPDCLEMQRLAGFVPDPVEK